MGDDPDRRKFLKVATCGIGGVAGLIVAAPLIRLAVDPAGKQTVTTPSEPLDLGPASRFKVGAPPTRVEVVAPVIKDGWTAATNVVLGAAWVRRISEKELDARSAICPHLGCAVGWDTAQNNYLCPCHDSRFDVGGAKQTGPSERGLDKLPIEIDANGNVKLTWVLYKLGKSTSEPA